MFSLKAIKKIIEKTPEGPEKDQMKQGYKNMASAFGSVLYGKHRNPTSKKVLKS